MEAAIVIVIFILSFVTGIWINVSTYGLKDGIFGLILGSISCWWLTLPYACIALVIAEVIYGIIQG